MKPIAATMRSSTMQKRTRPFLLSSETVDALSDGLLPRYFVRQAQTRQRQVCTLRVPRELNVNERLSLVI